MKSARRTGLACCLALLGGFTVHARDLAAWRAGDTADEDITTPVALDLIDAEATAARQAEVALKTPAIFRSYAGVTNALAGEVLAAFAQAHSNFLTGLQDTFHQSTLGRTTVLSPDFGYFLTEFNVKNKKFPVTADLARQWAGGKTGQSTQTSLVERLLQTMGRPVRPDSLPAGFTLGDTVRLVPARSSQDTLTVDDAGQRGQVVPLTGVPELARLRGLFSRDFSPDDQLMARALAAFLRPNCEPDADLTRQARDREVRQLVVAYHYDAGQVVVRHGQRIDSKTQAALARLSEKLLPGQLNQQIAAAREQAQHELQLAQAQQHLAQQEHGQMMKAREQALELQGQALNTRLRHAWLAVALAAISAGALLVCWRLVAQRRRAVLLPVRRTDLPLQNQPVPPAALPPQLAQALKAAVVQELAAQRHELLQTQQNAATEVMRLMHRLNELHAPLQNRLNAYESRIQELERELAARTEENRELLKLKIDLLRQQLEAERVPSRVNFN